MFKLLALDVDGTLTDGGVYIDALGNEFKRFDIQDGMGIAMFRKAGGKVAIISGRYSIATERRAKEMKIDFLVNGAREKLPLLMKIAKRENLLSEEIVYVGDDVNDVACANWAGMGVAVANAVSELREAADYVTLRPGGSGAIREVTDMLLSANAKEISK